MNPRTRAFLRILALAAFSLGSTIWAQNPATTAAKPLPSIRIYRDGHLLETVDGRPFFWLGDTAWELIHHTTREEASYYLHTRGRQGFNVIQTVVLSEFNGRSEEHTSELQSLRHLVCRL